MARPMRIEYPGATHHVTARGHQKKPIFKDDRDREHFLELLEKCARSYRWTVTVYVLMTNHFHFVVQTTQPNLGIGMRCLNSAYAGWFNARYKRINSLFGDRYCSVLVESEAYMQRLARYVVLNPVRAKMVDHPADYKWSSYRATAGLVPAPRWLRIDRLMPYFGDKTNWRARYVGYVNEATAKADKIWKCLRRRIFLVTEEFLKRNLKKIIAGKMRSDTHPALHRLAAAPAAHAIADAVATAFGMTKREIRFGRGGDARMMTAWLAWFEGAHRLRKIAALLRLRSTGHISNLVRRAEAAISASTRLQRQLELVCASLA